MDGTPMSSEACDRGHREEWGGVGHEGNLDHTGLMPEEDAGPFRFERRELDRWPVNVHATAFQVGGADFGAMHEMRVTDYGDGGVGAISRTALPPGTAVSIGFSAPGMIAKRGTVLRCDPDGDGYRVAIQFEMRLAA